MTPNDALTQLEKSHRQSYNSNMSTPSLRRRLTRSPSPAISFESKRSRRSYSSACSSDSDSSIKQMTRRRHATTKPSTNGHANGISHVPEEYSIDDVHARSQAVKHSKAPRKKIDWEIPRKTLHASIGFLTIFLYTLGFSVWPVIEVIAAALVVIVSAELLRFRWKWFEKAYERCLGFLMRETEKTDKINGVIWYLCGTGFVLLVYPTDVAVVSILILAWADTAASTFGRMYGSRTPKLPSTYIYIPIPFLSPNRWPKVGFAPQKSTAGFMGSTATGFLIATSFWGYFASFRQVPPFVRWNCLDASQGGFSGSLAVIGIISGVISGVVEALDLLSLDDNLTLPILSGAAIWATLTMVC